MPEEVGLGPIVNASILPTLSLTEFTPTRREASRIRGPCHAVCGMS